MNTFLKIQRYLSSNLWSIPAIIAFLLFLLAPFLVILEEALLSLEISADGRYNVIFESTRTLLAPMVTVFGIVVPLTFSFLLRAASQFSPMTLRIYRKQPMFKVFIGVMLGVILYLVALIACISYVEFQSYPVLASATGVVLVVVALCSIPTILDRLIKQLEPTFLASALATDLKQVLFDLELVDTNGDMASLGIRQDRHRLEQKEGGVQVRSAAAGYIVEVDFAELVALLEEQNLQGWIPVRAGDFVIEGTVLMILSASKSALPSEFGERCAECFRIEKSRANISDLELQLDELVSIAVKALSPGVNDLSTAIQCLDHIEEIVHVMLNRRFKSGIHRDESGAIRLYSRQFDYQGFVHAAFDRIRQNGADQPAIVVRILQMLERLVHRSCNEERADVLKAVARDFCAAEQQVKFSDYDLRVINRLLDQIV